MGRKVMELKAQLEKQKVQKAAWFQLFDSFIRLYIH